MMRCIRYGLISAGLLVFSVAYDLLAQKAPATRPPTLKLIAQAGPVDAGTLIDPEHAAWQSVLVTLAKTSSFSANSGDTSAYASLQNARSEAAFSVR